MSNKIKVIITGATGMVGEGVLHECLLHNDVEQVLVVNRKPCGVTNPKLREIIHADFFDFSAIENSVSILPTGQSGNVFSKHYKDQAQKYIEGNYVKMMLNKDEIELSKDKLVLKPMQD